jgi:hypothetical protein
MARKTTGNGVTTTRRKKTETPLQPVEMQGGSDVSAEFSNNVSKNEGLKEVRNGKPVNTPVPINQNSINQNSRNEVANQNSASSSLEEEIRHRAYELYLERRANGGDAGDPHQDWLAAEREILSRRNSRDRKSA